MNSKRRAGEAATPEPTRKRKRNEDTHFPDEESVETTQELGEKIISLLKRSQDKNGRLIATEFLDLPDRKLYPDYYEHILMPLSINIIEQKLHNGEYPTMTDLESDLKRMVQNAKDYNSSKSDIFEDAERIRKALSNFMPKHNPAYQDPDYRAIPTPIPDHVMRIKIRDSSASGSEPPSIKLKLNAGGRRRSAVSAVPSEPVEGDVDDPGAHDAQLALLDELSAQEDAINFEKKPPRRELPHYYKVIERPTSINDVRSLVQQGKITTWDDFARETRLIWSNAKEYNEPGSVIYSMTEKLEAWLEPRLQEHGVPPKVVPRLSLKTAPQPRQLKLKVGTPTAQPANGNAYTVDHAALERQRQEMSSALSRARDGSQPPRSTPASTARRSVSVANPDVTMTGVNGHPPDEPPVEPTKQLMPPGPANIPTPTLEGVPPQHAPKPSPYPAAAPLTNGYHHPSPPQNMHLAANAFAESTNPIDRKFRDPNKSSADALLQSVTYMTNPFMPSDPKWKLVRYASPSKTQTSYYTYLPSTYSSLRVLPELHPDLRAGKRKYKLFVLNNGAILPASPDVAGQGVYDLHLVPGENVVTVESIAALKEGERKDYARDWEQFDFEKITFYIFLRPKGSS